MTDRFRFRVWNNREWDDEYGQVYYDAEQTYDYLGGKPQIPASSFGDLFENDQWIVEQCTGLKDKNGKLIYEGDILGDIFGGYVGWCDKEKSFELFAYDWGCMSCSGDILWADVVEDDGKLEVIGNIHENKDLLEG